RIVAAADAPFSIGLSDICVGRKTEDTPGEVALVFDILNRVNAVAAIQRDIVRHLIETAGCAWLDNGKADVIGSDNPGGRHVPAADANSISARAVRHPDLHVAGRTGNERTVEIDRRGVWIIVGPQYGEKGIRGDELVEAEDQALTGKIICVQVIVRPYLKFPRAEAVDLGITVRPIVTAVAVAAIGGVGAIGVQFEDADAVAQMIQSIDSFVGVCHEYPAVIWAVGVSIDGDTARIPDMIFEVIGLGTGLRPIRVTAGRSGDADGVEATANDVA